ncbi:hypothetical protein B0A49_00148 [Cryomyces minteri]|uniref:GPI-anchored wall transfer protein n=1 Tax=Cryomyces minteri TaxID=331657 RepID=A0A4U0Y2X8_9PEZI|nr:hypothetical protein B0A49_00148 [Cryomyces minteri]
MANNYKALKEAFVSNLTGGTVLEINKITLVAPAAVLLWSILQSRHDVFKPYNVAAYITDFLLNCGAILLATTLYSSEPLLLNGLIILPAVAAFLSNPSSNPQASPSKPPVKSGPKDATPKDVQDPLPIKPFVTSYRGTMMIITCIAILAVDFKVFPRRFGKVENWGTSLMDLGVGSFVFSAGVVSARSVLKQRLLPKDSTRVAKGLLQRLSLSARHSFPLLVLGLIRLFSVKGLDYAEHVSEYGVHWNFFFTLAFVPPAVALFQDALDMLPSPTLLPLLLGAGYQMALDSTDLKAYILTAPRTDLLSQNREGVFSFVGYLAIFLAGQATGIHVLPRSSKRAKAERWADEDWWLAQTGMASAKTDTRSSFSKGIHAAREAFDDLRSWTLGSLAMWSVVWVVLYVSTTSYYGANIPVSRRLANLPYLLWVAAFNCCQLTLFCAIETYVFPGLYKRGGKEMEKQRCSEATSKVLHAFNRNGLAIFLLANVLTGLVNLTLPTLEMGDTPAVVVLMGYIGVLCGVALGLDHFDVSLKL